MAGSNRGEFPLTKWIRSHYGQPNSKFPTRRKWSIAAKKNPHAVYQVEETGIGSPEMIAALARAVEVGSKRYVIDALMIQGLLIPEDLEGLQIELTPEEREHIREYTLLSPTDQRVVREIRQSLHQNTVDQESTALEQNTPQEA